MPKGARKKLVKPPTKSARPKDASDSDSAPENMSFSTGRQLVMESMKNAVDSIQREKRRSKEKRKQRLEKYKQQKEEKDFGNLKKLPDEVLKYLPDQIPVKLQNMDSEAVSKERSHEKHNKSGSAKVKRQASDFRYQSDVDYIPLSTCGATEFGVMPLDSLMRAPKSMAERAAEFRQKMLFGDRVRRGQANAHIIYQQKLKASGRGRLVR